MTIASGQASQSRGTWSFIREFLASDPARSATMIGFLVLSGLAEGLGVIGMLPVLEVASRGSEPTSGPGAVVVALLAAVGLKASLGVLLMLIVAAMSLKALLLWLGMRYVGFATADVTAELRLDLLRGLLHARWPYFQGQSKGQLANALGTEAQRASSTFLQACTMFANAVLLAVYALVAVIVSWQAAAFAVLAGAAFLIAFNGFVRASRRAGADQTALLQSMTRRLVDVVGGLKAVKAMGLQDRVFAIVEREVERFRTAQRRQVSARHGLIAAQEPAVTLALATGIYALVRTGHPLTEALVLGFIVYRLLGIAGNAQRGLQSVAEGESAYWSLKEVMTALHTEAEQRSLGSEPPRLQDGIELEDVWFAYEPDDWVLEGVSLRVEAGSLTALVGESGSGKTTVADLLLRLVEPTLGRVLLDGVPIQQIDVQEWRRRVGYVPQEPLLFHDTVRNNITVGDPAISDEEVERALREAEAWEFVSRRREGWDAIVGEHGGKFSGGQRQRITIARALVRRPQLLILDEATTGLDRQSEEGICNTLRRLRGSLTILTISHQPAMREAADHVLRLERGVRRADRTAVRTV